MFWRKKTEAKTGYAHYAQGSTFMGKGVHAVDCTDVGKITSRAKELLDIDMLNANRNTHVYIFGASGSGKSMLQVQLVMQDIKAGRNVVFIDPKASAELFSYIVQAATESGRTEDLMYCSPIYPEHSIQMNPFSHYSKPEELVNHCIAGVPHSKEPFFYALARSLSSFIVFALILKKESEGDTSALSFSEIGEFMLYDKVVELRDEMRDLADDGIRGAKRIAALGDNLLGSEGNEEYFAKVTSSLRVAIDEMTIGSIGEVIGNVKRNDFVERVQSGKGTILYVQTGTMMFGGAANTMAKIVTSSIQTMSGRYDASGLKMPRPLCYYGDEYSNIVYQGAEDLWSKSRSAGVWITAASQSRADLQVVLDHYGATKLLDNASTFIVMKQNDLESSAYFAELAATKKRQSSMTSLNGSITNREVEVNVLIPDAIRSLKPREFYYFGKEGKYKVKAPPVEPSYINVKFPSVLGDSKDSPGSDSGVALDELFVRESEVASG
jgi:hypothetical protein